MNDLTAYVKMILWAAVLGLIVIYASRFAGKAAAKVGV